MIKSIWQYLIRHRFDFKKVCHIPFFTRLTLRPATPLNKHINRANKMKYKNTILIISMV